MGKTTNLNWCRISAINSIILQRDFCAFLSDDKKNSRPPPLDQKLVDKEGSSQRTAKIHDVCTMHSHHAFTRQGSLQKALGSVLVAAETWHSKVCLDVPGS